MPDIKKSSHKVNLFLWNECSFDFVSFYKRLLILASGAGVNSNEQTLDNLCGDLNKGYLPLNPTGQNVEGVSYPL